MTTTTGDASASQHTNILPIQDDQTPPLRLEGGRFAPGHPGNSPGRPRGARNRATLGVEARLASKLDALSDKLVSLALDGDIGAMKMCMDRLAPRRRTRPAYVDLPELHTSQDVTAAQNEVIAALALGDIEADHAQSLAALLEGRRQDFEQQENARDAQALMQRLGFRTTDRAAE